ncbi:diflavin flavoprotein [Pseudanabaena sp. FACHB-2040]|uniref:diflavin flavoprotein n=1 Tax=Pseudanabaena sp. FACHB-2040 TaxID=2692859 RepID=UPI001685447B|nr:diflavin flavoprotein [Pseudanabaena sp. FACHB-2040]MBD2258740.1 flavin reductase [Pseudanabaena sp. FACHB-2040]
MVALTHQTQSSQPQSHLTLQVAQIGQDTTAIRCLDWDRSRFDIEFALNNGTTYNSFLIEGQQTALVDTSHSKFRDLYLNLLQDELTLARLDYLIVSHTEPDHSGLVADILQLAPQVTVVGSKVAIQFLENMVHQPFQSRIVKSGDTLDLGQGHILQFFSAPNLHWPDTIFTYDLQTRILYTCDAFGMHYCDDHLLDEEPDLLERDFKYYYDCLMGPNARSVLGALKRMEGLEIGTIATGHGPLLHHHIDHWTGNYRQWSQAKAIETPLVAVIYVGSYGYSTYLANAIANGIFKTGVDVELADLREIDLHGLRELVGNAAGLVIGMPPQSDTTSQTLLQTALAAAHAKQSIGLFETGGGEDEPIFPLRNRFQEIGLMEAFTPILVKTAPEAALDQLCQEAGTDLGQWLTRDRTVRQIKAIDGQLERALGRISSGLYLLTVQRGNVASAMLASWVTQASLAPLGVAIAVAKDRAITSFLQIDDTFVLNILEEDRYQPLMKHFLKRFAPGADRFAGIKTYPADNGCPILAEALAYLECTVTQRMECSDHWIIYATVQTGRVSKVEGFTAVHHRKVGTHY